MNNELITAVAAGDSAALKEMTKLYGQQVKNTMLSRITIAGHSHLSRYIEDWVEDPALIIWRACTKYNQNKGEFLPYLRLCAANTAMNTIQKHIRRQKYLDHYTDPATLLNYESSECRRNSSFDDDN